VAVERRGLGRGLSALIPADDGGRLQEIRVERIASNPRQPREALAEEAIDELAASIREVGVLQPLLVREVDQGYELVAGERRLRAARKAGLERVPAIVRDTNDADLLREALIENVHRTDLNPLEEAAAYRQLLDDFGVTHEELARRVGKRRPAVTNALPPPPPPPGRGRGGRGWGVGGGRVGGGGGGGARRPCRGSQRGRRTGA
jgi:ParB family transcriptional regulator, chromosome partitioning protein